MEKRKAMPEYARRIEALRGSMTQREFAAKLGVGQGAVSAWESGSTKHAPSAEMYLRLARVAAERKLHPDAMWFWGEAGVKRDHMLAATREELKEQFEGGCWLVPHTNKVKAEGDGEPLPFPVSLILNRDSTTYVRLSLSRFDLFSAGGALLIDESQTDWNEMLGQCAAMFRKPYPRDFSDLLNAGAKRVEPILGMEVETRGSGVFAAWLIGEGPEKDANIKMVVPGLGGARTEVRTAAGKSVFSNMDDNILTLGRVVAWIPVIPQKLQAKRR